MLITDIPPVWCCSMARVWVYSRIALIAGVFALIGCGGGSGVVSSQDKAPIVGTKAVLPDGLPAPSALREVKTITSGVFRYGSQYASTLPSQCVTACGDFLAFTPAWWLGDGLAGAAYAIYTFNSTGYSTDNRLHLAWQTSAFDSSNLWIGLANFAHDRWDWFPGYTALAAPYDAAQYTENGKVYAVVLCLGNETGELRSISICPDEPPVVLSVSPTECIQGVPIILSAALQNPADSYSWNFGGGATPDTSTAVTPEVTPAAAGVYSATLTVANSYGQDVFSYKLISYDAPTYIASGYVKTKDSTGMSGVTLSFTGGLPSVTTDSSGYWSRDGITDGDYTVTPSIDGKWFNPVFRQFTVDNTDCSVADFIGGTNGLRPDTLYAIPMQTSAAVGEPVTIRVATGQPPNTLQCIIVGLTIENAATYVPNSFNIGEPGGARTDTDGYWALMGPPPPANGDYVDGGDGMTPGQPTDIGGGFKRYDFIVSPMGRFDPPVSIGEGAALFNLQLTFSTPGVYHLGFQLFGGMCDQTFYKGDDSDYHWGVLDNSNTITVY
jgi:PKD repeat protein